MLRFQGLFPEEFVPELGESESLLGDLAGNSFSSCCISAVILSLLAALRYESDSEEEQLTAIGQAFRGVGVVGRLAREDQ